MASWKKDSSGNWKKSESKKKNYTVVDGKKVEQTKTVSSPATSSDTWRKDTVSLEEAAQQSSDVERGVINIDTGSTSIEPAQTEKISLEQAAAQTEPESSNRILASESTDNLISSETQTTYKGTGSGDALIVTTETTETRQNLTPIKVGSNVRSAAQLDPVTTRTTTKESVRVPDYLKARPLPDLTQKESSQDSKGLIVTPDQAAAIADLRNALNTPNESSGSGGSSSYTPGETETALQQPGAIDQIRDVLSGGYNYGQDPENNTPVKMYSSDDYKKSYGLYQKGTSVADEIRSKGSNLVEDVIDIGADLNKFNPFAAIAEPVIEATGLDRETSKQFTKGLAVNTAAGLVQGASAVPLAAEVFRKEPETIPGTLLAGSAAMVGGTVKGLKEDPVTTLGELTGALLLSKAAGKSIDKVGDRVRTVGKKEVPIETFAQERIITGDTKFPTVSKGTRVESILQKFKETAERHPEPTALEKLGGEYGVHVSPGTIPKETTVLKGSSETPGLYVGPDASLHFSGIRGSKYKLLGLAKDSEPAINFIQMNEIKRLPADLRANRAAANEFMLEGAKKGTGYTSVKMEQGVKVQATEPELIIPPETRLIKNADLSGYYTKWKGRRLPVNVFENLEKLAKEQDTPRKAIRSDKEFRTYDPDKYSSLGERTLLTDVDILSASALRGSLRSGSVKSSPSLSRSRIGSLPSSTGKLSRSYVPGSSRVRPSKSKGGSGSKGSSGSSSGSSGISYPSGGSGSHGSSGGSAGSSSSGSISMPRIKPPKPIESISLGPRKPVPARSKAKTKVMKSTIRNIFTDPMKALSKKGRRKS